MSTTMAPQMITDEHMQKFLDFSFDKNPLHCDRDYAYRTQFRKPVCFGMSTVLFALGAWAQGRAFSLTKIKGDFKKPIFPNEPFVIDIQEEAQTVTIQCKNEGQVLTKIVFDWTHYSSDGNQLKESSFTPLSEASTFKPESLEATEEFYQPNWREIEKNIGVFHLNLGQMPYQQLASFLWASYFVGMKYPGDRALFSSFNFTFAPNKLDTKNISIKKINFNFHPTFQLLGFSNEKEEDFNFKIQTFVRPLPIQYPIKEIAQKIELNQLFQNKVVFISGGTRGFGSVLAKIFALQGAKVIVSYLHSEQDARALEKEASELGYKIFCIKGDLSTEAGAIHLKKEIESHYDHVDVIVNNASPIISPLPAHQQNTAISDAFIRDSVSIYINTCMHLIPMMKHAGGKVINISSSMVKQANPLFSHYIEAKNTIEKNTYLLASQNQNIQFFIARPPKMLTDQTNVTGSVDTPVSAVEIATRFFSELNKNNDGVQLVEFETL